MTARVAVIGVEELAEVVEAAVVRALANAGQGPAEQWVDAKTSPLGSLWTFRRLAKARAFPTSIVGRKLMAKRSDVERYMAEQGIERATPATAPNDADPMSRLLAKGRLRAIGGGKR